MFLLLPVIVSTLYNLRVKCGNCKKDQVVPTAAKTKGIRCKFCDHFISPRRRPGLVGENDE